MNTKLFSFAEISNRKLFTMGDKIPVEFEFQGKTYKGFLDQPLGGDTRSWSLTVNGYHWGVLIIYANDEWIMTNHNDSMRHLSDYFRDVVLNWYK